MTLTNEHRWAASGVIAAASLIIFSPIMYRITDATIGFGKGYLAEEKGYRHKLLGVFIHAIVLFFVAYGLLSIKWDC